MQLQERIIKSGMTAKDFAKRIGTDSPMVSKFNNYKCLPIPPMMKAMCEVLDCDVEDIYADKELYYTKSKSKASKKTDKYKLTVNLPKDAKEFFKKALKKCGYRDITDWIFKCYLRLQKRYEIIVTAEKEKALRKNEKPEC